MGVIIKIIGLICLLSIHFVTASKEEHGENHKNDSTVERVEEKMGELKDAFDNLLGHKDEPIVDKFSSIAWNDTREITKENFPDFSDK